MNDVLTERARALARPPDPGPPPGERVSALWFRVGAERYAVEIARVREVRKLESFAPVPGAPAPFLGVTMLRGVVLPVADLRAALGRPATGLSDLSRLVVLADVGLLVGDLEAVAPVRVDDLAPPPEGARFVRGVTADARVLIDAAALEDGI